jgi:hypothetical protein
VPLANIAFTFKFLMGDNAVHLTGYMVAGLVVVVLGLGLYRSTKEIHQSSKPNIPLEDKDEEF